MKRRFFGALLVALAIAVPTAGLAQNDHCEINAGKGHYKKVKLELGPGKLLLKPVAPRCVAVGGTFPIELKLDNDFPLPEAGAVRVTDKEDSAVEYEGVYDPATRIITVKVTNPGPTPVPLGSEHGYNITIDGHGVLDPKVRIIDTDISPFLLNSTANQLLLDEMGVTVEDVLRARQYMNTAE